MKKKITQTEIFKREELEKDIQKRIILILKLKKCYAIRFNSGCFAVGKRFYRSYILPDGKSDGLPDIMFLRAGKAYLIEVKRKGGKLRDAQKRVIGELQDFGAETLVADNWEDVLDFVNGLN